MARRGGPFTLRGGPFTPRGAEAAGKLITARTNTPAQGINQPNGCLLFTFITPLL
jgi:hypothetical protein